MITTATGCFEGPKQGLDTYFPDTPASFSPYPEAQDMKPVIIGLYGVPGSGKSFLLNRLRHELDPEEFQVYEGSEVISALVPGGLAAFKSMPDQEKVQWRGRAIAEIGTECASTGRTAVVSGHFIFWSEGEALDKSVCTANDLATYTHILYLQVDPQCIAQRRVHDELRSRPAVSPSHLSQWQQAEIQQLEPLCRRHGILFSVVTEQAALLLRVSALIRRFRQDASDQEFSRAQTRLDQLLPDRDRLRTVLVLDGDKTLAAEDTGAIFWQIHAQPEICPLKVLFGGPLGYSDRAFRQAALLYESAAPDDQEYERLCGTVASSVKIYPEFLSLLRTVAGRDDVGVVVVTCGLGRVWEKALEAERLSQTVKVVGGGRSSDALVVTPATKAAIVSRLRHIDNLHVLAFGDSPLDLPMLLEASEAYVVVGDERTRSRSMEAALAAAIDDDHLRARQVLLPEQSSPRLDETRLPRVKLSDQDFVDSVTGQRDNDVSARKDGLARGVPGPRVLHATGKEAAKLLMSPMRDAAMSGPQLRASHRQVGWYLATEYLSAAMGVEEYPILHVQGHKTTGHRLLHERQTSIVALMRGGEPLALGISEAFPLAIFVHADSPSSIRRHHVQNQQAIVLVDSVVNTGKTLLRFIERIRHMCPGIRVAVVAGVVQTGAILQGQPLAVAMSKHNVQLVALRLSDNKFTGTKTTDTGNRLFNTTHLS